MGPGTQARVGMTSGCPAPHTAETLCRDLLVSEATDPIIGQEAAEDCAIPGTLWLQHRQGSPAFDTSASGFFLGSAPLSSQHPCTGPHAEQCGHHALVPRLRRPAAGLHGMPLLARTVLMGTGSVPCVFLSLVACNHPTLSPLPVPSHLVFNLPPLLALSLCLFNYASSFIGVSY